MNHDCIFSGSELGTGSEYLSLGWARCCYRSRRSRQKSIFAPFEHHKPEGGGGSRTDGGGSRTTAAAAGAPQQVRLRRTIGGQQLTQ